MRKNTILFVSFMSLLVFLTCKSQKLPSTSEIAIPQVLKKDLDRIKVLNFGTFHMGNTSDYYSTEFDENNKNNIKQVHAIAKQLAAFKPTVIIVEWIPESNDELQEEYLKYVNNPNVQFEQPSEVELLAFELGRLSNTKRIYGIDHKLQYEWNIHERIENDIDSTTLLNFMQKIPSLFKAEEQLSLLEKLRLINTNAYLDLAIAGNADLLTHVGTEQNLKERMKQLNIINVI